MERLEKTKKDLNERRDTTINETHQLEEERRRYNDVKGTVDAIQEVNREIRDLQGKRDYAVEYIRNNSANAFLLLIGQDIKSIIGKNDEKKMELKRAASSAGVPSNNYFPIQNDIIAKHLQECPVCKTALSEDAIEHIKTMLRGVSDKAEESKKYNKKQNELDDIQIVLKEHLSGLPKKLNQFCTDLFETNERINENRIKLDNLNKIASNSDIDAIKDLSSRLSKLYEDTSRLDRETFENDNLIKNTEKNLRNVRKELSESTALNDQQAVQTKRMRYLDHLIIRLDSVIKSVSENRRKDILVRADEIFNSITNKPDTYRGLEYDDRTSFSMHIVRNDGQTVLHPSSGEKHVLAISFLVSLSLNTERLSPMMMDTPLSRLDIVHKMNIGRTIASLDNQILFLAQPGEMDDQTRESFEPAVAKMFMSEPTEDNTARITEVEF
jgi:DNA sulfur modification protein DndD